jgi:L-seryl-tRNA(Ser) seleniumtransferase
MESQFRCLPSVDRLMSDSRIKQLRDSYTHDILVGLIRQNLEENRVSIAMGNPCPSTDEIVNAIRERTREVVTLSLKPVINASGVIVHTNIGRAPMSEEAIAAMDRAARGYCNLEFDLQTGSRGSRNVHVEQLLCRLTGAEDALVVNNNASAVLLGLSALARRREVIVPRGQAVEIGGSFRIPEIMRQSGAKLVEVGTTNCTYVHDFEQAISPRTAALLRVHSSNFRIVGFTHSVALEELVQLGDRYDIPVLDDLGSGCLLDTSSYGLAPEPMLQDSIGHGAGLVFSSGDKLLGGPQAGIIVGRKALVDRLKKHPLARATRIDKVRLAGLAATLIHYLKGEATQAIPVWRMISTPLDALEQRARIWAGECGGIAQVVEGESMVGGGSLPGATLPTKLVAIGKHVKRKERNIGQDLALLLREEVVPIVGRMSGNVLLLDPRTVLPEEEQVFLGSLRRAIGKLNSSQ